ncbi:MAG: hypothetical protein ACRDK7_02270 [Solirubrobacteraceae bacterium]
MKRSTVRPASEVPHTDTAETDPTEKAYGDFHLPPQILPDLVRSGPIMPVWLSKRLNRLFRRTDTHVAR